MYMGNYPSNLIKDAFYNSKPHRSSPQKKKNDITLRVKLHTSNKKCFGKVCLSGKLKTIYFKIGF